MIKEEPMNKKSKITPYLFILPITILLITFYVLPIIISFVLSFTNYRGLPDPSFVGLNNYKALFQDEFLITAFKNTAWYVLFIVPLQTALALFFAIAIHKSAKNFASKFFKTILFIPVISSMVLVSVVWRIILNGDMSPLNQALAVIGITINWLSPSVAKITIIMITIWKNVGYFMIIYLARLNQIPTSYYEASKIDGAGLLDEFRYITLPLLKPATILVVFLSSLWSLQIFDIVYMLTGGGPANATTSLVFKIYETAFKDYNIGYAMSIANVLLLIAALFSILQRKLLRKESARV